MISQPAAPYLSQAPEDAALRSCGSVCALRGPVRPQRRPCGNGPLTDQRMELDEDARAALDLKQQLLLERIKERPEITATWFQPDEKKDGGRYIVSTGRLKRIHEADQVLILADGLRIPIGDIVELESECIRGLL